MHNTNLKPDNLEGKHCPPYASSAIMLLPITYYLLPIAYCLLPIAYCLLP
ncbi:MAG: hypothetical protein F6K50_18870 [Moorea sp. SIO3I7]|nr:hypothetical protein [Moorena sp. SIO3I8]NEN97512.1 hypothetical protein [Moorena sp. SIO3I7]NEO06164.1 hypothetical protein [Moorena sp. SIO3I8]